MKLKNVRTDGLLECTQCGNHFRAEDMIRKVRCLYNSEIVEKRCPYCNSYQVEPVREQMRLDKFRYFNLKQDERN